VEPVGSSTSLASHTPRGGHLFDSGAGRALGAIGLPVDTSYLGGDTESRIKQWLGGSGVVATKFAPTPFRNDAQSVVDACKGSCARLGVDSVDLLQIHMPDVIQPFKALGVERRNEEAHWEGLAACYHAGLAKNVGVSNYGARQRPNARGAAAHAPVGSAWLWQGRRCSSARTPTSLRAASRSRPTRST